MELVTIRFPKWEEWNPRRDIKRPTWFAMSNRITEDDQIQSLTDLEFRAFIHMFCLVSQGGTDSAPINLQKAERVTGIAKRVFDATIQKLRSFGICTLSDADSTENGDIASATLQDKTQQNTTRQDKTQELVSLWNEKADSKLPRVDLKRLRKASARYRAASARLAEESSLDYWILVIETISASDFCRGMNARGWVADFDFLVKPDTHHKVLEGKYDNRKGATKKNHGPAGALERKHDADQEFHEIMSGVADGK